MKLTAGLVLAAIPLLGGLELAFHLYFAGRAPAFASYAALAPVVAELQQPGDVVVVAPHWADPAARAALGDALLPMRDEARPDVSRYGGAIEISIESNHAPDLAAASFQEVARRDVGAFVVRRLVNPAPAHVRFDFTDHVDPEHASVREVRGGASAECAWNPRARVQAGGLGGDPTLPPQRFECPSLGVGVTIIADERFLPRRCIWSPASSSRLVTTRFTNVELGAEIRGHGGIYWIQERAMHGATVLLSVRVDGDEIGVYEHHDGDGWKPFSFPLGAHAHAAAATVEFTASTKGARDRPFCFEADTR